MKTLLLEVEAELNSILAKLNLPWDPCWIISAGSA